MSDHDIIDVEFAEVRSRPSFKLIWADRIAIGLGLVVILLAAFHAAIYDPTANLAFIDPSLPPPVADRLGDFTDISMAGLALVGAIWLLLRIADFIVTGRVRH